MLMVDNTSIMAHHDAELEGGGDHLIDRLLESLSSLAIGDTGIADRYLS